MLGRLTRLAPNGTRSFHSSIAARELGNFRVPAIENEPMVGSMEDDVERPEQPSHTKSSSIFSYFCRLPVYLETISTGIF